jgi:hypothetical protein
MSRTTPTTMSGRRRAVATLLLTGGCLSAPPGVLVDAAEEPALDGAVDKEDAGADADAAGCDTADVDVRFDSVGDITGWASSSAGCIVGVDLGVLFITNAGKAGICQLVSNLSLDLTGRTMRSRIAGATGALSMSFGLVLSDGQEDPLLRRRLAFELDDGMITVRDCIGEGGQCPTEYTEFAYSATEHVWWGFEHAPGTETVYFITAAEDKVFAPVASATGVTDDLVACVEAKFASFEETPNSGRVEFDDVEVR